MSTPAPGSVPVIPDFELIRPIGGGAYGEVWLARTSISGAYRAIKIVRRARFGADDRPFHRELEGLSRFHRLADGHPRQLAILHVAQDPAGDLFYYVMELADDASQASDFNPENYAALTLQRFKEKQGIGSARRWLRLGIELAEALAELHDDLDLIHRDIKPSNLIFVGGFLKIADIGLVTPQEGSATAHGTPDYEAPERNGTKAADIYGAGRVLWFMLFGKVSDFPSIPDSPTVAPLVADPCFRELNAVIDKACQRDPQARYASARDLLEDLKLIDSGGSIVRQRRLEQQLHQLRRIIRTAALFCALVMVGWFLFETRRNEESARRDAEFSKYVNGLRTVTDHLARQERGLAGATFRSLQSNSFARESPIEYRLVGHLVQTTRPEIDLEPFHPLALSMHPDGTLLAVQRRSPGGAAEIVVLYGSQWTNAIHLGPGERLGGFLPNSRDLLVQRGFQVYRMDALNRSQATPIGPPTVQLQAVSSDGSTMMLWQDGPAPSHSLFLAWDAIRNQGITTWDSTADTRGAQFLSGAVTLRPVATGDPPATLLAACFHSTTGTQHEFSLLLHDSTSGRILSRTNSYGHITGMRFSPDGSRLAIVAPMQPIRILDATNLTERAVLRGHRGTVLALEFSPDSSAVASTGEDGTVRVWQLDEERTPPLVFGIHDHAGTGVVWDSSRGEPQVLSGSLDGTIRRTTLKRPMFDGLGGLHAYLLGGFLISSNNAAVWATTREGMTVSYQMDDLRELRRYPGVFQPLAWSRIPDEFFALGTNYALIRVNASDGRVSPSTHTPVPTSHELEMVVVSPTGNHFALVHEDPNTHAHHLTVWDADSDSLTEIHTHPEIVKALAFENDDRHLIYCNESNRVHRIPFREMKRAWPGVELARSAEDIQCMALSPDQSRLLIGTGSGTILSQPIRPGAPPTQVLQAHSGRIFSLTFTRDGRRLISGGGDGRLNFWSHPGLKLLCSLGLEPSSGQVNDPKVYPLGFAPNEGILGAWLADGRLLLYRTD